MKKTLVFGAATAAVALTLGSCAVSSCQNNAFSTLYGPPPADVEDDAEIEALYGTPTVDEDEPIEDVYGPPVDYSDDDSELIVALYGPPADLDEYEVSTQDDGE